MRVADGDRLMRFPALTCSAGAEGVQVETELKPFL